MNKITTTILTRHLKLPFLVLLFLQTTTQVTTAQPALLDIVSTLNFIQALLMHVGPILSAVLFIVAGVFFALGQLFPSHQRATFHSTAIDIIIGAIIVAVLSVAANGLAAASTQLLSNVSANSM